MLAIEGSMVARFTITAAGKGFKVEGEEKD
jgi:hypothetical protein